MSDPSRDAAETEDQTSDTPAGSTRLLVRMVAIFLLVFGTFYTLGTTQMYDEYIFQPYMIVNANLSTHILNALGEQATASGAQISSPKFSVTIARGCDGLPPIALFVAALCAFPAPWILRLPALLVCVPILAAFNLVRIVSLYFVGAYYPDLFHVMHVDVWQVLYILFGVVLFSAWLWWAMGKTERAPA
ncbi:MAG: exosortase H [bacterium]|nr:exosortase H [bacterium]